MGSGNGWASPRELSAWFESSRWWKHLIVWLLVIDLMLLFVITAPPPEDGAGGPDLLFLYGVFGGLFVAIGSMVVMHRAIVGEKTSGSAAWVLSKPVTRPASWCPD